MGALFPRQMLVTSYLAALVGETSRHQHAVFRETVDVRPACIVHRVSAQFERAFEHAVT